MPHRPKRPCSWPGCGLLADGRYCDEHRHLAERAYNRYGRDPETRKRYGREWRRIRERYIHAHPLCEQCEKDSRLTIAEEVHHILPLSEGGTHDGQNLMALCKSCHSKITAGAGWRGEE